MPGQVEVASQRDRCDDFGESLAPGGRSPAAYAAGAVASRGRLVDEPPCPTRNPLQRDRDRVLHSTSFRRLIYKTQMFLYHEGDHYRTRLTHSLEVAQIARTICRQLRLDEDLGEALSLAHDLGHPPFGHAGERALDGAMAPFGGFDHNVQSFRIVAKLENKYARFDGLNLCWETLEGLIKHNGPADLAGDARHARLRHAVRHFNALMDLDLGSYASAEAQVAAASDDIAWMTHDIDDGLRAGLIAACDLKEVPLIAPLLDKVSFSDPKSSERDRTVYEVVRQLITVLVADVVAQSRVLLREIAPGHPDDIRQAGRPAIAFTPAMWDQLKVLRSFLFARLYKHDRVMRVMNDAEDIVRDLVALYFEQPNKMPEKWAAQTIDGSERQRARVVSDFVAGMTDRYAINEHRRLFDATPDLL